jgi:uncharacterized OB-fold protein
MIKGAVCECGRNIVPFRMTCPACGKAMARMDFDDKGTVLTHTTLYSVAEGFEPPLFFALVEIGEGARVLCRFQGKDKPRIGEEVRVIEKDNLYICQPFIYDQG